MNCKNCGALNNENSSFCSNCGTKLDTMVNENQEAIVHPVEQAQPVEPVTPVAPVQQAVNTTPTYNSAPVVENKSNGGKIGLIIGLVSIIVILLVVVILFATGILSFGGKGSNNNNNNNNNNGNNNVQPEVKKTYKVGDAVTTVDGSEWHVIGVKGDNLTLLLDKLVVDEIGYGASASEEDQKYANSNVKKYIDETYMPDLSTKIDAAGGDSSKIVGRIINMDEYTSITYTKFDDNYYTTSLSVEAYDNKEEVCKMFTILGMTKSFWTSSNVRDYRSNAIYFGAIYIKRGEEEYDYFCSKNMYEVYSIIDTATDSSYQMGGTGAGIRPVIETPTSNIK